MRCIAVIVALTAGEHGLVKTSDLLPTPTKTLYTLGFLISCCALHVKFHTKTRLAQRTGLAFVNPSYDLKVNNDIPHP
jgi:hydrogenase/urease accessory protein HupE